MDLEYYGSEYGGWQIPRHVLDSSSICYTVGAGEDISFDIALARTHGCKVRVFDPTPKAVEHFKHLTSKVSSGAKMQINNTNATYDINPKTLSLLDYHSAGIWKTSMNMRFYAPRKPGYVSHSISNNDKTSSYFEARCLSVKDAMNECDDTKLDLLKLDTEGAEHEIIKSVIHDKIFPKILCLEFDRYEHPPFKTFFRIRLTLWRLKKAGYKRVWQDGAEMTFIRNIK